MKYKNPISFLILFLLLSVTCFSQSIVNRANSSYTVQDARFSAQYNLFVPKYTDTTAINAGIDTCGAIVYLYSTNTLWYRSCAGGTKTWVDIGAGGGGGGASTAMSAPSYQSGVVIADKGRYDAFPSPFLKQDTIFVASINGSSHASGGAGAIYRSIDGGMHYDSLTVGTDSTVSNYFAGQFDDTTTIYAFNGSNQQRMYFRRSVDGLQSFQTVDSIILTGDNKGLFFASHGVTLPSGKFLFPAYFFNTVTSTYSSEIIATDDGINFDRYGVIYSGSTNKNEASFELISGETDGTSTLIAVLRDQSKLVPEQYISTDGGVTFSYQGDISVFGSESALGPTEIIKWEGRVYLAKGVRITTASGGSYVGVSECLLSEAVAGVSSWSTPSRIYDARWQYKASGVDFGYVRSIIYNNQLVAYFYDIAPQYVSPTKKTRIVTLKLLGHNNYERNRKTVQAIAANSAIGVDYSSTVYDGDNSWSSADTAFKFKRDGVYSIQASFTYPADLTGTYRQGLLKIVDPGLSTTTATQLLDKVTITGSNSLEFNRIKLSGLVYVQAGMLVKVLAMHDATTSQDLVNTDIETRAKIYIKRIE